jgi:hypothetical protein
MPLDFPNSPTTGDLFNGAGVTWRWDGVKWNSVLSSGGPFLPLAGGTVTGPVTFTQPIAAWIPEPSLFNGITAQHVPRLNTAIANATSGAPALIGIIGDSTSVATSSSAGSEGMTEHLRQAITEQFGAGAFVSIFNFGIGGQTWTTLDGIPSGFDYWYTNHATPWLDYPKNYTVGTSVGCDCLIIAMGTNDRNSLDIAKVASVIAKVRAWSKPCDIILVTNPRGSSVYSGTAGAALQNTFDYSASFVRSFAIRNRLGLIDANRWLTVLRDGYDPLQTTMQVGLTGVTQNFPYTFPTPLLDYSFRWYAGAAAGIFQFNTFTAQIGADPGNTLQIAQDGGGNFAYQIQTKTGTFTTNYTVTTIACPTSGDASFEFCVKGSHVTFTMTTATYPNFGVKIVDAWFDKIGGTFTPTLGFASGGNGYMQTAIGVPARYQTQASDADLYGDVNGNVFPYGGSAGLHMSSIGQQRVYGALFRHSQWSNAGGNALPLTGGTIDGPLYVTGGFLAQSSFAAWQGVTLGFSGAGGAEATANSAVGNRGFRLQTNGVDRWRVGADATAEGGANAGSDFQIYGFQDGGGPYGAFLTIKRSTGVVSIPVGGLAVTGVTGFNGIAPITKRTGYGAPTGTATRSTFVTGSVTLPVLAEHVKALIDDLTAYGLIGA